MGGIRGGIGSAISMIGGGIRKSVGSLVGGAIGSYYQRKATDAAAHGSEQARRKAASLTGEQVAELYERGKLARGQISEGFASAREAIAGQYQPTLQELSQGYGQAVGVMREQTPSALMESRLSGALGPEEQQAAIEQFQETPGQAYLREEQERALLRNAAAIGGLGGGNVRTALQEQAFGRAATQMQQNIENLRAIAGRETTQQAGVAELLRQAGVQGAGVRERYGAREADLYRGEGLSQAQTMQDITRLVSAARAGNIGAQTQLAQRIGDIKAAGYLGEGQVWQEANRGLTAGADQFQQGLGQFIMSRFTGGAGGGAKGLSNAGNLGIMQFAGGDRGVA